MLTIKLIIPAALLLIGGVAYFTFRSDQPASVVVTAPETSIRAATPQEKATVKKAMTGWGDTFGKHP